MLMKKKALYEMTSVLKFLTSHMAPIIKCHALGGGGVSLISN